MQLLECLVGEETCASVRNNSNDCGSVSLVQRAYALFTVDLQEDLEQAPVPAHNMTLTMTSVTLSSHKLGIANNILVSYLVFSVTAILALARSRGYVHD